MRTLERVRGANLRHIGQHRIAVVIIASQSIEARNGEPLNSDSPNRRECTATPLPNLPQASLPQASLPQASLPQDSLPQASLPQASLPQGSLPQDSLPQDSLPQASLPQASLPASSPHLASIRRVSPSHRVRLPDPRLPSAREPLRSPGRRTSFCGSRGSADLAAVVDPHSACVVSHARLRIHQGCKPLTFAFRRIHPEENRRETLHYRSPFGNASANPSNHRSRHRRPAAGSSRKSEPISPTLPRTSRSLCRARHFHSADPLHRPVCEPRPSTKSARRGR